MSDIVIQLMVFTSKVVILFLFFLALLLTLTALIAKGKMRFKGHILIKNLNKKYDENKQTLLAETLPKKKFKQFLKGKKKAEKLLLKSKPDKKNVYVLTFHGDIKASSVDALREEITAVLNIATPQDEMILRLESAGGIIHGYGLAAAQLMRVRAKKIPLTITIDKVAASGGYMMACIADTILCAPFAILGSIGVIVQLPNFHRYLQNKNIDFEQHTAGEFKRTITVFGENTDEGRHKLQQEIEDMHQMFKNLITTFRPKIDIQQVATGEYWLGQKALELKLADEIKTSDEYLFDRCKEASVYEISYETKKTWFQKLTANANGLIKKFQL
ncbi:MAG: protease SohB [Gammaproteobacteria bacterium RIFCSPHIGHO2_12_FULL_38_14]|nr:MAG: protease SohB [Gammaproteobacteria bacterium RIFCSPHIGHO2_12_FULL_38_14]